MTDEPEDWELEMQEQDEKKPEKETKPVKNSQKTSSDISPSGVSPSQGKKNLERGISPTAVVDFDPFAPPPQSETEKKKEVVVDLDSFIPNSPAQFEAYAEKLAIKLIQLQKSPHFVSFFKNTCKLAFQSEQQAAQSSSGPTSNKMPKSSLTIEELQDINRHFNIIVNGRIAANKDSKKKKVQQKQSRKKEKDVFGDVDDGDDLDDVLDDIM
ncbi:MAG: hypothetical protein EZS28_001335 [Streblomastix strix]|uniref:Uncharacterized protein n=1 Tax=Streblomastix strix TaxID=222440 RepID=A0A5J4X7G6_9EUKA|nr:MAG: hypothetical protein EZS28_001335 [Streblomastix strix]